MVDWGMLQVMKLVRQGKRPEFPAIEKLPGPSFGCFAGLADYQQLIRWGLPCVVSRNFQIQAICCWSALYWRSLLCPSFRECWAQNPEERPQFNNIASRLHTLLEQLKSSALEV